MNAKNLFYFVIISILILVGLSVLILYYTQDFEPSFNFKNKINFYDIEVQTSQRGDVNYLARATTEIGNLTLENNGIFTKVYTLPRLVGCLDLNENSNQQSNINQFTFNVFYSNENSQLHSGETLEISSDSSKNFKLIGDYGAYDVPMFYYTSEVISGISIYELPADLKNPFGNNYNYEFYSFENCNYLKTNLKPLATISFKF